MRARIFASLILLSACDQPAPDAPITATGDSVTNVQNFASPDLNSDAATGTVKRLPGSENDLRKPLQELSGLDDDGLPLHTDGDSFTGGEHFSSITAKGSVHFYTMPDGGLWKVRVTSGWGDRCGTALSSKETIEHFIGAVTPAVAAQPVANQLAAAMRNKEVGQVRVGSLRYTASGNCIQLLDVTELDALPPEKRAD